MSLCFFSLHGSIRLVNSARNAERKVDEYTAEYFYSFEIICHWELLAVGREVSFNNVTFDMYHVSSLNVSIDIRGSGMQNRMQSIN